MRSVRIDDELDQRVRRAAAREGVTVSEFIRAGAAERADRVLAEESVLEAWADYIGSVDTGDGPTDLARRHSEVYGELLEEKHARPRGRRAG